MSAAGAQEKLRLGFLTAVENPQHGFLGGLLVTNHMGRPLEFQCTSPVKPNHTQKLLYGPTLRTYVLAELIGKTLIGSSGVKPHVVLVAEQELLELREQIETPTAWILGPEDAREADDVQHGQQAIRLHPSYVSDRNAIEKRFGILPAEVDLREPFERVTEALRETLSGGAAA